MSLLFRAAGPAAVDRHPLSLGGLGTSVSVPDHSLLFGQIAAARTSLERMPVAASPAAQQTGDVT